MNKTKLVGAALAATIGLSLQACAADSSSGANYASGDTWVKCYGINSCRGQSSCHLTTTSCKILNQCKNQNACQGKGWVIKTADQCKALGGTAPETPIR